MSLLLNGAKTMTIAGTEMQCLEIYTGESYTFPLAFVNANGSPANALQPNAWALFTSTKYYTVDNVTYVNDNEVVLGNLTLNPTQPAPGNITVLANWSNANIGTGYLYVNYNIATGANGTPSIQLANSAANSTLVIIDIQVSKQSSANASLADFSRNPLGFIVRYL